MFKIENNSPVFYNEFMKPVINVGNRELASTIIAQIKENNYVPFDIRITNSHIMELNNLIGKKLFKKSTLYINSHTLWEIMQEVGDKGKHNYHGLTVEDIYDAIYSIRTPDFVYIAKSSRYAVVSSKLSHFNIPLVLIIEIGAGTTTDINANINKIVTIYPKDNLNGLITKMDSKNVLYIRSE